jgi:type IV pilus assembly protein PilY1
VQAFYGLIDDLGNTATDQVLASNLTQQQIVSESTVNGTNVRVTTAYPMTAGSQGWYINLDYPSASGERSVSDAVLENGRIIFTTVIPQGSACQYGGTSWLMELSIDTGGQLSISPLDINGDGKVNSNDYVTVTYTDPKTHQSVTATVPVSGVQSDVGIIKTPAIIQAGNLQLKAVSGSTGKNKLYTESDIGSGGRESWQQVQ